MTARWLLIGALALAACNDNTRQIELSIDTTAGVPCDIDSIRVIAKASGTATTVQSLRGAHLPVSVTLLDDTSNGKFTVDVFGLQNNVEVLHTHGDMTFRDQKFTQPVWLDPKCSANTDNDCRVADATPSGGRLKCGADVTRYHEQATQDVFVDACTDPGATLSGKVLTNGGRAPVELTDVESMLDGFGFQFYGRPLQHLWVSKDGYIAFKQSNPDPLYVLVPGSFDRDINHNGEAPPQQSVIAFWDTITQGPQGVCYELKGQQLRVTWTHACLVQPCLAADTTNNLNFTITLDASDQRVVLTYGSMSAGNMDRARGATATVGLVNAATGCVASECSLSTGLCQDGTPCGYSQVFSGTSQMPGVQNIEFVPITN
jgi:hypothetical protein